MAGGMEPNRALPGQGTHWPTARRLVLTKELLIHSAPQALASPVEATRASACSL